MKTVSYVEGTPTKLHVLDFGLFQVHANGRIIGICGFLIHTSLGEKILVDTGYHRKYVTDPHGSSAEDGMDKFGDILKLDPVNFPKEQLSLSGVDVSDIDLLIITHTHIDHVGGLADFPNCPILMSSAERALDRPLYWADARPLEWPDREYLLLDEDTVIGPGFKVLQTPGHAPGQISLELELPKAGLTLITSDAISRPSEIDDGFGGSWDEDLAKKNFVRLMDRAKEMDAFVIYGHSPDQWPKLRKTPEYYS
jgi:N-acyl homoserine lactone hydrolase|tara:strand:- start:6 stop:764 length:759 start_codon:yes stop_codon:yes gene_type:complete